MWSTWPRSQAVAASGAAAAEAAEKRPSRDSAPRSSAPSRQASVPGDGGGR